MPVIVYVWPPTSELIGHSSMKLSDGTYISFWPQDTCSVDSPECASWQAGSVEEDKSNEDNRDPKEYPIAISQDGEKKIKTWWESYKKTKYHFITNNCSTIIYLALKIPFPYLSVFDSKIRAWVPEAVGMVAIGVGAGQQFFTEKKVADITEVAKNEAVRLAKNHAGKIVGKRVAKKY